MRIIDTNPMALEIGYLHDRTDYSCTWRPKVNTMKRVFDMDYQERLMYDKVCDILPWGTNVTFHVVYLGSLQFRYAIFGEEYGMGYYYSFGEDRYLVTDYSCRLNRDKYGIPDSCLVATNADEYAIAAEIEGVFRSGYNFFHDSIPTSGEFLDRFDTPYASVSLIADSHSSRGYGTRKTLRAINYGVNLCADIHTKALCDYFSMTHEKIVQEIDMWLANRDYKDPNKPEMDNKTKIKKAGFDLKKSFRHRK